MSHLFWVWIQVLKSIYNNTKPTSVDLLKVAEDAIKGMKIIWSDLFWVTKLRSVKGMTSIGFKPLAATSFSTATDWSHVRVAQAALFTFLIICSYRPLEDNY